jgi:2-dehydropantoate 2-reductase
MKKEILIIGAGAVGLVYGKHFTDGGHSVTFYVKEKYRAEMEAGSVLYHMNRDKSLKSPIQFKNYQLATSFEAVAKKSWDQIYLCISSTAIHAFDFAGMQAHLSGSPTIVMLSSGASDLNLLTRVFKAEQIVQGMITLISYQAPLAIEKVNVPGIAYWFPPMMPTPISGNTNRRDEVIQAFQSGKIKAKASQSVFNESLFPSAFLATFLIALEAKGWKFDALKKDPTMLKDLRITLNEVFTALEKKYNVKRAALLGIISRPTTIKMLLRVAPKVMPMDIETYLEYHFLKVNSQTKFYVNNFLLLAQEMGTPHQHLKRFNELT